MDLDFDDWFKEEGKYLNETITIDPEPEPLTLAEKLKSWPYNSWCSYEATGRNKLIWMRCNA